MITVTKINFPFKKVSYRKDKTYREALREAEIPFEDGEQIKANDRIVDINDVITPDIYKVLVLLKPKGNYVLENI